MSQFVRLLIMQKIFHDKIKGESRNDLTSNVLQPAVTLLASRVPATNHYL